MTITSIKFLEFCICTIALFLIFPKKYRWISLLISSIAFYWIIAHKLIAFVVLSSLTVWYAAKAMSRQEKIGAEKLLAPDLQKEDKKAIKNETAKIRKRILLAALILNIGLLIVFKIFNFYTEGFHMLAGIFVGREAADTMKLILPLGISYYTFSVVGYLLDIYWKRYEYEENPARLFLFAIYYPRILQGPISRYPRLGMELKKPELRFTWNNFVIGSESILLGCFKKLVLADRLGMYVSSVLFEQEMGGAVYVLALVFDALQIYTDFSGYMDIVIGISRMFDIELEQNFNHPFFAGSVPEFWRRWHMTLGGWFKDYVYYPISVSKTVKNINKKAKNWKSAQLRSLASVIIPVMCTWILTGLWHGTGSGYLMWGLYYGTLIALSVTFSEDVKKAVERLRINTECFSFRLFRTLKIFCIFMGGRFLGSTMSMAQRKHIIKAVLLRFWDFSIYQHGLGRMDFFIIFLGVALLIAIGVIEEKENIIAWFNKQNKIFCAVVIWILFFMVFLLGIYGSGYDTSTFMYQQF